jgi:2-polyprenyl-3-methyl-5-hydroxy-6-metoxy-1,4-benzoquinol methylase
VPFGNQSLLTIPGAIVVASSKRWATSRLWSPVHRVREKISSRGRSAARDMSPSTRRRTVSPSTVVHRANEYDSNNFSILLEMQSKHFWYRGRHRFLMRALQQELACHNLDLNNLSCIDLGGGCGGWVQYLGKHLQQLPKELAIADSQSRALEMAGNVVGNEVKRYQIDLLDLKWEERWDVVFLLDVLEHIPQDSAVLQQIWKSLRPGGLLFVTTPALKLFWSYNDDLARHVRRYSRADHQQLAKRIGFNFIYARYFMFFLSPLLLLIRLKSPKIDQLTEEEIKQHLQHTHRVPSPIINSLLTWIFSMETPLGLRICFPWGTSVLAVMQKPNRASTHNRLEPYAINH